MIALPEENLKKEMGQAVEEPFYPQAEFWCVYILAYYQWKYNVKFETILEKYPLESLMQNYHLLHEADITKTEEL